MSVDQRGIDWRLTATDAATAVFNGVETSMGRVMAGYKQLAAALGVGLSLGFLEHLVSSSIDAMERMEDLRKSTALTMDELAGFSLVAKQSGTDLDGLAKGIDKMSVAMGKDPEKFVKLGVTAKDNAGAFRQLSDIFNNLTDVQQRNALAQTVFGKAWADIAPVLSLGSDKIGELLGRGAALAPNLEENAKQAKLFKDSMAELTTAMEGAKNKMVGDMLPALIEITNAVKTAYEETGKWTAAWVLMGGLGAVLFTDKFDSNTSKLNDLNNQLKNLIADKNAMGEGGVIKQLLYGTNPEAIDAKIIETAGKIAALQAAMSASSKKVLSDEEIDAQVWKEFQDAQRAAEFLHGKQAGEDMAKELERLRALGLKSETDADAARYKALEDFYAAVGALRNMDAAQAKALMDLGAKGEEDAAIAQVKRVKGEIEAINDARNAGFDEATARQKKVDEQISAADKGIVDQLDRDAKQGFDKMFQKLGGGWQALMESFAMSFKRLVADAVYAYFAKPFVLQIIAGVAGAVGSTGIANAANTALTANQGATGGVGLSSLSNLFSMSGVANAALQLGSATGSAMISNFALGMQSATLEAASVYGTAGTVGYAIPYVGWVLAAYAAYEAFFKGHETIQGSGSASLATSGAISTQAGELHGGYDPTNVTGLAAAAVTNLANVVKQLGGTLSQVFTIGVGQGGGGDFNVTTNLGARQLSDRASLDSTQAQLETMRAVLVGLQQAADFPDYIKHVFDAINAGTATEQQINDQIAFANTVKQIHDNLTETRSAFQVMVDAAAELETQLGTSAATFKQDFLAAIDAGISPEALAQWQKLAGVIDTVNAAVKQAADQQAQAVAQFQSAGLTLQQAGAVVQAALNSYHVAYPSPDQMAEWIRSIDVTTAAGQAQLAVMLQLASAYNTVNNAVVQMRADLLNQASQFESDSQKLGEAWNVVNDAMAHFNGADWQTRMPLPSRNDYATWLKGLPDYLVSLNWPVEKVKEFVDYVTSIGPAFDTVTKQIETNKQSLISLYDKFASPAQKMADAQWVVNQYMRQTGQTYMPTREEIANRLKATFDNPDFWNSTVPDQTAFIESMQKVADAFDLVTSQSEQFKSSLHDWLGTLLMNKDLSPLTAQAQLAVAHDQYVSNLMKAQANDPAAQANYQHLAEQYLQAAKAVYGFGGDYSAIFASIYAQAASFESGTNAPATIGSITALQGKVDSMTATVARLLEQINQATLDQTTNIVSAIVGSGSQVASATTSAAVLNNRN